MSDKIDVTQGAPDAIDIAAPDRPLAGTRAVEAVVMVLLFGFAITLGLDNVRTGIAWQSDGPEAGYFPFYLCVMLGLAALYGMYDVATRDVSQRTVFVTRAQFVRVLMVFLPAAAFVLVTQFLGIYVGSLLLIAGFMHFIGRIALWKSVLTAAIFVAVTFFTFEVSFNVIMPKGPIERALGY